MAMGELVGGEVHRRGHSPEFVQNTTIEIYRENGEWTKLLDWRILPLMTSRRKSRTRSQRGIAKRSRPATRGYGVVLTGIVGVLEQARASVARAVNFGMTTSYWEVGRRIVEYEQRGQRRAEYGEELLKRLAHDLTRRLGRGFGEVNLSQMRRFYLMWPSERSFQTASEKSDRRVRHRRNVGADEVVRQSSEDSGLAAVDVRFVLPWSHYVRLMTVENPHAREFYETEALRGGWSVRQLDRQIATLFYERTTMSRDKSAMLRKGGVPRRDERLAPQDQFKDPFVLEFLELKDEYSEGDLEGELVKHLESFLLEMGGDFAFVARQRRLRVGDKWYRVDLVFFHRVLRCLVIVDLKLDAFTHADAGQMHLYLNYAKKHWMRDGENPPVGLILCTERDSAVAQYALEGLPNKVLAAEYRTTLPKERQLASMVRQARQRLEMRPYDLPSSRSRK